MACIGAGGYAEYAVADARHCFGLQADSDFARAAALPLTLMTAHDALATQGQLCSGATELVQGASSAVGCWHCAFPR